MKKKAASTPQKKSATPVPSRKPAKKSAKLAPALYKASPTLRPAFYDSIARVLSTARRKAYRAIDSCMVEAYWDVGRRIVEEEQHGKKRADYGTALLHHLSLRLAQDFGPGYDERELRRMRQFYRCFPIRGTLCPESASPDSVGLPAIQGTLCPELSWSHYRLLIRVEDPVARTWYMQEAASQNWSVRALNRQIHSLYYQRLLSSRNKRPVIAEMLDQTAALAPSPRDFIRDPVVLEFLDLPIGTASLRESRLEQAIIGRLQHFLLELGKGFAFVARQQRVSTETKDFFIDLVFYNYILKCFVLIDLKVGELTHADISQMDMYVRLYEDQHKGKGDNPTVGLILCTEKDQTVVKYSVLKNSKQLFASKYQLYLPSEEELRLELERERDMALREEPALFGCETSTREEAE
jgi:predicted nuclease of restriction endonuclease-like (RecB) superfamily